MKIAIVNDTHFGYKNSTSHFLEYQERFLKNNFFPYCEKNNITEILHLGDLFDNRKHITIRALNFVRKSFLEEIRNRKMKMNILPGNHDTSYKNTNDLCTLIEVLRHYKDCIHVHMKPTMVEYDKAKPFLIGLVPWIANDNYAECLNFIKTCPAHVLVGHFALSGFKYIANSNVKSDGLSSSLFTKYDHVLSGHFHTKNGEGNILYLGSQYQFNWSDVDDRKYFHVFDTETRELTPIENKDKMFVKLYYDDEGTSKLNDILSLTDGELNDTICGKYVRVIVHKKKDFHLFDTFINRVKSFNPYDLNVVENFEIIIDKEDSDEAIEDTTTLIDNYVDKILDTDLDKDKLKKLLHQLHTEATMLDIC